MEPPAPFLSWLHISDSHFQKDTGWRDDIVRKYLLEFLQEKFQKNPLHKPDFIFFTGDLAFGQVDGSRLSTQYKDAWNFLEQLLECCDVHRERIFTVPGNHDVNRKAFPASTKITFQHGINKQEAFEIFNGAEPFKWQKEYGKFVSGHLPHQHKDSKEEQHYYATTIEHNGRRIAIAGLNTAWMCTGKEEKGNLCIALEFQLNDIGVKLRGEHDIRIVLMHHPISWLGDEEEGDCKQRFTQEFNFVLNGHQHNTWGDSIEKGPVYIAVGALGAENKDEFGFNLTYLFQDGNGRKGESHFFCLDRDKRFIPKCIRKRAEDGIFRFSYRSSKQADAVDIIAAVSQVTPATFEELQEIRFTFKVPNDVQRGIPAAHFVGRDALLEQLRGMLTPGSPTGVFGLDGMGGIGKSELARQLVKTLYKEKIFRDGILWLHVHKRLYEEILEEIWEKLSGVKQSTLPFERKEEILKDELEQHSMMLVVLDNCDEPDRIPRLLALFPQQSILITARSRSSDPSIHWNTVDTLEDEDGRALLRQVCPALGKVEDMRLDAVLQKIHGLPLAITAAGVWLSSTERTPEEYCEHFDRYRLAALISSSNEHSERDIYACFDVSWEGLALEERLVFAICSLFGGDSFPEELLIALLKDIPYFSAHDLDDDEKIKALINRLYQEKMLSRPNLGRLAVHALLSEYGSEKLSQTDELKDIGVKILQTLLIKQIEKNGQNFAPREKQLIEDTIMRLDDKADAYELWNAADGYWIGSGDDALRTRICDHLLRQYSPDTQGRKKFAVLLFKKADAVIRMGRRNKARSYLKQCLAVSQDDEESGFWATYLLLDMVAGNDCHLLLLNNLRKSFKLSDSKPVIDAINGMLQETLGHETGEMCYTFAKNRISIQSTPFNLCLSYENYANLLIAKGDIAAAEEALSKLCQSAQSQNILPGILASIEVEACISYWKGDKDKARQGWQTFLDQQKQQEGWAGVNNCQIFLHALELESGSVDLPSLQRLRDDADQAGLNGAKFAAQCLLIEQELRAGKHGPTLQRELEAVKEVAVGARDTEDLLCVMLLTIWHELSGEPSDWTKIEARMARVQATFAAWQAQPPAVQTPVRHRAADGRRPAHNACPHVAPWLDRKAVFPAASAHYRQGFAAAVDGERRHEAVPCSFRPVSDLFPERRKTGSGDMGLSLLHRRTSRDLCAIPPLMPGNRA
jgi:hypothetical protein